MEDYILKFYEKAKKECAEVEQGFERFDPKTRKKVIRCFIIMFASCVEMFLTLIIWPKQFWYLLGAVICVIVSFMLFKIDTKDEKIHLDQYADSYKKKLEILEHVLIKDFDINTREKMEELINLYQKYVDKKNNDEKKRTRIIWVIISAFAGVLTISFENMGIIGVDFQGWIYLASVLLILVAATSIWIYSYSLFGSLKGKYEMMIKDIRELLLIKY